MRRRALTAVAIMVGAFAVLPSASGAAAPVPTAAAKPDPAKLDRLTKQLESLEKQYGGDLAQLRDARYAAKKALLKAQNIKQDLAKARTEIAQMASSRYMSGGIEPSVAILATEDPDGFLNSITMADHVSQNQAANVAQIQSLVSQQEKVRKEAQAKVNSMEKGIKDLLSRKKEVQKLVNQFKPQSQVIGAGGLTQRLITVRTEIDRRFGPFPVIGCLRPGDPQDHGSGRACDFMESTGGQMPSAARQANGDQVAEWCIQNASKYGVKYVIWKQRIYDMRSPGWRAMSDRGGITANHYDHVHLSTF